MKYDSVIFDLFGTLVDDPAYTEDLGVEFRRMMRDVAAVLSTPLEVLRCFWSHTEDERYTGFFPSMASYLEHLCQQSDIPANPDQLSHAVRIRLEYFTGSLETPRDDTGLDDHFRFYNSQRPHQALGYRTPAGVFSGDSVSSKRSEERRYSRSRAWVDLVKTAGLSLNNAPILSN